MLGTANQRLGGAVFFQGMARVAHIFVTQPPGEQDHHVGGRGFALGTIELQSAVVVQAGDELHKGPLFARQQIFDLGFQAPVAAEQVIEVAVQKPVFPQTLKQGVDEKPSVFHIAHIASGFEQGVELRQVLVKQGIDQLVFGRKVVVQVARADAQFRRNQVGGDIGLAKAVEQ